MISRPVVSTPPVVGSGFSTSGSVLFGNPRSWAAVAGLTTVSIASAATFAASPITAAVTPTAGLAGLDRALRG